MNLLGIDIGTQSVKAALFDSNGRVLASASRASLHHQPTPGATEEDPEFQLESVFTVVRECMETSGSDSGEIAAIGIDGQMAGVIGIGVDGRAVTPYDSWLDTRCAPYIQRMQEEAGDDILRLTGNAPSFNHGPKMLWWKHERPDVFSKISKFVQPGAYAAMRLCNTPANEAFIDSTYLHFSGFADNLNLRWDDGLATAFDFPIEKLPRIVEPHATIGKVDASMAEVCGLKAGTPVIAGCGDSAASFLSCGATRPGIHVDIAGTASVFAATVRDFRPDESGVLGCGRAATPGLWHPYAYINGGGRNLTWFHQNFANRLPLKELDELAGQVERTDDLPFFIPHLGGRVSPGWPNLRGSWAGLGWNHDAGICYRAMLEGIAFEYSIYQSVLHHLLPEADASELRVTGGGQKCESWNQIKADVLQMPISAVVGGEGAPMGSALLAGYGLGLFSNLADTADQWVSLSKAAEPDISTKSYYTERKKRYEQLMLALNAWA